MKYLFVFIPFISFAQSSFQFSIEPAFLQVKESRINELPMVGPTVKLGIAKIIETTSCITEIGIYGGIGFPKEAIEKAHKSIWATFHASYTKLYPISHSIFLGGTVEANYRVANYRALDQGHLYYYNFWGIGPQIRYQFVKSDVRFEIAFALPILGAQAMPEKLPLDRVDNTKLFPLIREIHHNVAFATSKSYFNPKLNLSVENGKRSIRYFITAQYLKSQTNFSAAYTEIEESAGIKISL